MSQKDPNFRKYRRCLAFLRLILLNIGIISDWRNEERRRLAFEDDAVEDGTLIKQSKATMANVNNKAPIRIILLREDTKINPYFKAITVI